MGWWTKMVIKNPDVVSVEDAIAMNLSIPLYQRPYRWREGTALTLFNDINNAFKKGISEYRIGTLILHQEDEQKFGIVDGQQRMTTLTLLLLALKCDKDKLGLLNENYKNDSINSLRTNFMLFQRKAMDIQANLGKDYLKEIKKYILENCSVVRIITDSEQEAFQFFDSQNSRGKSLAPHDLLKSYHLREMNDESEVIKRSTIDHWESLDQNRISVIFAEYLYPILCWYKKRNGIGYDSSKIQVFKGIRIENTYPYATYHKASHLFIEEFNSKNYNELLNNTKISEFNLTMPIIAGKRFFDFVFYYYDLIEKVDKILSKQISKQLSEETAKDLLPNYLSGDRYIKRLLLCSLIMIADRFGISVLNDMTTINLMYAWSYSLRLVMHSVYESTVNKYAIGQHDRINQLPIFQMISEFMTPEDIEKIILNPVRKTNMTMGAISPKYTKIASHINNTISEGFVEL